MKVVKKEFGKLNNGQVVWAYTLENRKGTSLTAISYGATWQSLIVNHLGKAQELLVKFHDMKSYLNNPFHLGNTIGRVGGRLSRISYDLGGNRFNLTANDHGHVLHSGINGFDSVNWSAEIADHGDRAEIIFSHTFEDEFPGHLLAQVIYTLDDQNKIQISFSGRSTLPTLFNPMTHVYFNLAGGGLNISQHQLRINSKKHVEVDNVKIPTGNLLQNTDTRFDFSDFKTIRNQEFDDAWLLDNNHQGPLVSLKNPTNGIQLDINSDRNGVVVFTTDPAQNSSENTAIAIEMQTLPDAINHENFGNINLPANQTQTYSVTYQLKYNQ
ncbi:aldose epimerase family protein [Convivina praedatoris]|uniref:Maltose epimerase n=1 Tax=Convivina praedatoris TaxID=2880963 RepID=A0ABM9D2I0_9LACO|nr:aldose epimerase family protein [Convivina sp. LMG 32447]CAH1851884.1 Maltose epimerase [Convivina sp. LMG 32447]CAH1851917.1 Maltose epimerase [Convivina sp. LMG 32447]CAH1852980.1 Maltose epimerase [Convivina sp. LMG 32447]